MTNNLHLKKIKNRTHLRHTLLHPVFVRVNRRRPYRTGLDQPEHLGSVLR